MKVVSQKVCHSPSRATKLITRQHARHSGSGRLRAVGNTPATSTASTPCGLRHRRLHDLPGRVEDDIHQRAERRVRVRFLRQAVANALRGTGAESEA